MDLNPELTALLADLPRTSGVTVGDAFEHVSDYALRRSVDFGHEIATIERFEVWARRHGMRDRDLGVDRIVTTHSGELWAVQNKGYAASASVSLGDMNNFIVAAMGVPGVKKLLLVTSGRGLNANAATANRKADTNVITLDRRWLAEATTYPSTYRELCDSVYDADQIEKPFVLRDDQETAVYRVTRALRSSPEVQVHAACGTGKTVLSEALAQALGARLIVFFVPSLGLMRQTIRSWRRQTGAGGMHAVAVCSDDTVGRDEDQAMWSDDDIPCEVIRDPQILADYIAERHHAFSTVPVVVFATYHSEHLVVDAQHRHGVPEFDFSFADEAHTLVATQEDGGRRGELVKRKNDGRKRLLARHRVYATATPRLLSTKAQQRLAKQGAEPMDSMDTDSPVFGPIAHTLTFGEAITLGILSDYRVSIIAVPEQKYADFVAERAYVTKDSGHVLDAQTFAAVEAVKQAYTAGDKRMIVYVNRKDSANRFASIVEADDVLPGASSVLGHMPANQRDQRINMIRRPEGHILTNVRCLNEGVDIPTLDAVVFVDPKGSPVDIAQAIGRVLRRAEGKERGHIIIPVAVPAADWDEGLLSIEERETAMTGPNPYRPIFDIISTLASHDETIRHILTALRLGLGKRKNTPGVDGDELPDTPEELAAYLDSIVNDDGTVGARDRAPASTTASSVLGGGKVVLYAPGMSDMMRDKFASSMRLATVRESQNSVDTWDDHLYRTLVYGYGMTFEQAQKVLADKRQELQGAAA